MPLTLDSRAPIGSAQMHLFHEVLPAPPALPVDGVGSVAKPVPEHLPCHASSSLCMTTECELLDSIPIPSPLANLLDDTEVLRLLSSSWTDTAAQHPVPEMQMRSQPVGEEKNLDWSAARLPGYSMRMHVQQIVDDAMATCLNLAQQMRQEAQAQVVGEVQNSCLQLQAMFRNALQHMRAQLYIGPPPEYAAALRKPEQADSKQFADKQESAWHALQKYFNEDGSLTERARTLAEDAPRYALGPASEKCLGRSRAVGEISFPIVLAWLRARAESAVNPAAFESQYHLNKGSLCRLLNADGMLGPKGVVLGYLYEGLAFKTFDVKHIVMAMAHGAVLQYQYDGMSMFKQYGVDPDGLKLCIDVSPSGESVFSESSLKMITRALDTRGAETIAEISHELARFLEQHRRDEEFVPRIMILKHMIARTPLNFLYLELSGIVGALKLPLAAAAIAEISDAVSKDKTVSPSKRPRKGGTRKRAI